MSEYNKEQLVEFLDYAGIKGLFKKSTASSYQVACSNVLSILNEEESEDISKIDLDLIFQRFENLNGMKYKPSTLREYKRRVKDSIVEFIAYKENPSGWKPSTNQRAVQGKKPTGASAKTGDHGSNRASKLSHKQGDPILDQAMSITHRFPLRADTVVSISGLPFDVKRSEMGRLTAWLSNLVAQSDELKAEPQMLPPPLGDV